MVIKIILRSEILIFCKYLYLSTNVLDKIDALHSA